MFIERVTAPREEFDRWDARLRMATEPPPALVASFAWESDGDVTCLNVWDSPEAIAEFFLERVRPFVEAEGPPANKPERLGHAIRAYVRPAGETNTAAHRASGAHRVAAPRHAESPGGWCNRHHGVPIEPPVGRRSREWAPDDVGLGDRGYARR